MISFNDIKWVIVVRIPDPGSLVAAFVVRSFVVRSFVRSFVVRSSFVRRSFVRRSFAFAWRSFVVRRRRWCRLLHSIECVPACLIDR